MTNFLVDTENLHQHWMKIIPHTAPGDKIILFFTDATSFMYVSIQTISELTRRGAAIEAFYCDDGDNALDFQLSSYLGFIMANAENDHKFVIVSNDHGFDAVVNFWKQRGRSVQRMRCPTTAENDPNLVTPLPEPETSVVTPSAAEAASAPSDSEPKTNYLSKDAAKQYYRNMLLNARHMDDLSINDVNQATAIIFTCIQLPKKLRSEYFQNLCAQRFGKKRSKDVYKKISPVFESVELDGPYIKE